MASIVALMLATDEAPREGEREGEADVWPERGPRPGSRGWPALVLVLVVRGERVLARAD